MVDLRCHGCGQVHEGAKAVTLDDGTEVGSYSQRWREITEARWVLKTLPLKVNKRRPKTPQISRRDYIMGVQDRRGQLAADQLKRDILALWKATK